MSLDYTEKKGKLNLLVLVLLNVCFSFIKTLSKLFCKIILMISVFSGFNPLLNLTIYCINTVSQ